MIRLVLASASPRRAELLRAAGYAFDIVVPDIDETARGDENAEQHVRRLALEKSSAAVTTLKHGSSGSTATDVVLAADTVVVVDGDILGKPVDDDEAAAMLRR